MNTHHVSINTPYCGAPSVRERPGFRPARLLELFRVWHERATRRRELQDMPEYLLRDMGITREDVYREMDKPFWRP